MPHQPPLLRISYAEREPAAKKWRKTLSTFTFGDTPPGPQRYLAGQQALLDQPGARDQGGILAVGPADTAGALRRCFGELGLKSEMWDN